MFRPGDLVKCVTTSEIFITLEVGELYEVVALYHPFGYHNTSLVQIRECNLEGEILKGYYPVSCFELVESVVNAQRELDEEERLYRETNYDEESAESSSSDYDDIAELIQRNSTTSTNDIIPDSPFTFDKLLRTVLQVEHAERKRLFKPITDDERIDFHFGIENFIREVLKNAKKASKVD